MLATSRHLTKKSRPGIDQTLAALRVTNSKPISRGLMKFLRSLGLVSLKFIAFYLASRSESAVFAENEGTRSFEPISQLSKMISQTTIENHIDPVVVDDATSAKFLKAYIDALDPEHFIFLSQDIEAFKSNYETTLDDALKNGNIEPALKIFNVFTERLKEIEEVSKDVLDHPIDLESGEKVQVDRSLSPWPKTSSEQREIVRLQTDYSVLTQVRGVKLDSDTIKRTLARLQKRVHRRYARYHSLNQFEIFQIYINSFLHLFDPHSDYLSPADSADFNAQMETAKLYGIGAELSQDEEGRIIIVCLARGGAAEASGKVEIGDQITEVRKEGGEFESIENMTVREALKKIRGLKDSVVEIKIERAKNNQIIRDTVLMKRRELSAASQRVRASLLDVSLSNSKVIKIGVLQVPSFYMGSQEDPSKSVSIQSARLIELMKERGMEALILDLRWNGGGEIGEAVNLAGLFVDGPIVQAKFGRTNPKVRVMNDRIKNVYDGPLEVLVNHGSASAAEIVTGALQDYGRAVVVGSRTTFGKGSIQSSNNIIVSSPISIFMGASKKEDWGFFKITTGRFYRPTGRTTQDFGVSSDIVLPSRSELYLSESSLDASLKPDTINAVDYRKEDRIAALLPELKKRSDERANQVKEFAYIREAVAEALEARKKSETNEQVISLKAFEEKLASAKERESTIFSERKSRTEPKQYALHFIFDGTAQESESWYSETLENGEKSRPLNDMDYEARATLDEGVRIVVDLKDLSSDR